MTKSTISPGTEFCTGLRSVLRENLSKNNTKLLLALELPLNNFMPAWPCVPWYLYVQGPPTQLTDTWF
jgi:hypothetical protein